MPKSISKYLLSLEKHLADENPILLEAAKAFHELDQVAYDLGLLESDDSTARQISWWPLISVLGMFSAGKSTFINEFVGTKVQRPGIQAVDDKFTALHYSQDNEIKTLPGIALDADPRFPFYQISERIDEVESGEGQRVNAYLQLKTCHSERLKGKILIDSPGFDADSQRTATLRISKHIIDMADVVLIFFDAKRPEVGAMRDTLKHLVAETVQRHDSSKFMYILNQIDTAAKNGSPEDVVSAWQRGLAEHGLTAGRFFTIYSQEASEPITDEHLREHIQQKRNRDIADIYERIETVGIERAYRIIDALKHTAIEIENVAVPEVHEALKRWKKRAYTLNMIIFILLVASILGGGFYTGLIGTLLSPVVAASVLGGLVLIMFGVHFWSSARVARQIEAELKQRSEKLTAFEDLAAAFRYNTGWWRTLMPMTKPAGWNGRARIKLAEIKEHSKTMVQRLNNSLSNPSGSDFDESALESPDEQAQPQSPRTYRGTSF